MEIPDIINGLFEILGGPFIFLSIIKLYRDKKVRGISPYAVGFISLWGLWNLYYYPHLGQWASFTGGLVIVIVNIFWLCQIFYYLVRERNGKC